jgi:transposase InsO family protein
MPWFAERGVQVRAVMSDNGSAYVAHAHREALAELGLRHLASGLPAAHQRTGGEAYPDVA